MEGNLLIAFLLQIVLSLSTGCKYERLGEQHTMCIYAPYACPNSQLLRSGNISVADQDLILKIHNQVRSYVANGSVYGLPPANNMRVMNWDNELAEIAQRWADQCTDGHDSLRSTEQYYVGQNVARSWRFNYNDPERDAIPEWASNIELWISEYEKYGFNPDDIDPFQFNYNVGHYTQIIWGTTNKIGCGYTYFKHPDQRYIKSYVCNYGPGGNIIQGRMYGISPDGPNCSDCTLQPSVEYEGLCEEAAY